MHTQFRVLDKSGRQVDIVTKAPTGWRSAKVGRTAKAASTILSWHGKRVRLAALIAAVDGSEEGRA